MLTKKNEFKLNINLKFADSSKYTFTFITLFIILISIYSNSFYGEWHFDDYANIVENPYIQMKSYSWDTVKHCIYGLEQARPSRPLSYLSFALNHEINGLDVFGFHVVNFIVHYLAAVFLFLFIYNTLKLPLLREKYEKSAYPIALLATMLWAINPVFVTSITYIVQRMASMAGMFYIMSMYLYLKGRTAEKTAVSIVFFLLGALAGLAAILTKENAAMLAFSILIFDLLLIQDASKENIIKMAKIISLPLAILIIFGLIYTGGFSAALSGYELRDFTMMDRVLTQPRVILFYLSLLFYPINSRLTLLHDIDVSHSLFQPWSTLPAILLIIGAIAVALYLAKKRPLISFCIIFFFLNHLIEGSVFSLELIYEHRNYIPAMLLFIPVAEFIIFVLDYFSYKKIIQLACVFGIILIFVGLGDITYRRNAIVASDDRLWLDNIDKYPNLSRPYSNLGNTYIFYNLYDKGLAAYNKAMELNNFANIYARAMQEHNLGLHYFQVREYDKALPYFERSITVLPDYLSNSLHIARINLAKGEITKAGEIIQDKLKKYPNHTELMETFSLILFKAGKWQCADDYAKRILRKNQYSPVALKIRAEVARQKRNYQGALIFWKQYKEIAPLSPEANLALIEIYHKTGDKNLLREELANLNCYRKTKSFSDYLDEYFPENNLLAYVPDKSKILKILKGVR